MKCLLGQVRWVLLLNLPISWNKWRCLVQKSVCVNLWPKLNVRSSLVRNGNCQVVRLPSVQPADSKAELCKLRRTRNGWPECAECVVFCNGEGSWTCTHDWGIPWGTCLRTVKCVGYMKTTFSQSGRNRYIFARPLSRGSIPNWMRANQTDNTTTLTEE